MFVAFNTPNSHNKASNSGGEQVEHAKMGELIRSARKEKGLTQKDVAGKLGTTDRAVSKCGTIIKQTWPRDI